MLCTCFNFSNDAFSTVFSCVATTTASIYHHALLSDMGSPTASTERGPLFVGKCVSGVGYINDVEVGHSSAICINPTTTSVVSLITPYISSFACTFSVTKTTSTATTTVCWVYLTALAAIRLASNLGWTVDPGYLPREVFPCHRHILQVLPRNIRCGWHELHVLNYDTINDGIDLLLVR